MQRRILIIKLGAFGDFFLAQPAIQAIRRHHQADHLTLMTIPSLAPFARMSGLFEDVIEDARDRGIGAYLRMRKLLRAGHFDRVYDLQAQSRTDRYHWLMGPGRRPEWSGTARGASHCDQYPGRKQVPVLDRYRRQLAPFGIIPDPLPDLGWLDADISKFALKAPFALLIPGSSPGRPDKRWPAERYGALANQLMERGVTPVVLGTSIEQELAATITTASPGTVDLVNKTSVAEIGGLARRAWGAVGNDTGPTHLVAAVGCPTVALFSDASNPIHATGARVVVHHRPGFAEMDVSSVMAVLEQNA